MLLNAITPEEATGKLAELYEAAKAATGTVSNSTMMYSYSPELLEQFNQFLGYYMEHKTLSAPLLAAVRVLVAEDAKCEFCIGFNGGLLINYMGWSEEQVQALKADFSATPLSDKEQAMLTYIIKAVNKPHEISEDDLQTLRSLGWDEGSLFDGVHHGVMARATDTLFNTFKI